MNWPDAFVAATPHFAAAVIALAALKVVYLRTAPQPRQRCPWCDDDPDDDSYATGAVEVDEGDAGDDPDDDSYATGAVEVDEGDAGDGWTDDPDWWKRERNSASEE